MSSTDRPIPWLIIIKQTYDARCKTQLKRIYDTRQSQAEQQQQFLNPQQPQMALMQQQMAMQGMSQNQFPQAYAVPQPPHMQNLGNPIQQHPSQIPRPVQPINPMELQQPMVNGQQVPNMPPRAPQAQGQAQFTEQEQQIITQLTEQMARNVTPEQMAGVNRIIMGIPPDQRQQMQNSGINPAHAVFRSHAIKKFVQDRAMQQQRAGQGPRPASQISMRPGQQIPQPPTQQRQDPSFDQFLGQQQDALRHQEAGQVVVPASQGAPPQVRGTPHPQVQAQFGAGPMQPPNNFRSQPPTTWNITQNQHGNVSQTNLPQGQPQIPPQTPNLANTAGQTPQQQALQGQLGGLDNNRPQRTPQQNPNMPTLNRPLNPPSQSQNSTRQAQNTPANASRNVSGGQQNAAVNGQPSAAQQSTAANLQKFQRYVATIPEPQRSVFLAQFKHRQEQKKAEEAAAQAGAPSAPVAPMTGGGSKPQSVPKANTNANGPQPPTNSVNPLNAKPPVAQQSGPVNGARGQQQKFQPISLDEHATRMMDRVEFPRGLLNLAGENAKVPDQIKQWGQLKQWVTQNSNILPQGIIHKVVGLQSIVYQQRVAQANQHKEAMGQPQSQSNTKPPQPGVAPPAQMVAPSSSQATIQASTAPAPNPLMPVLPQPTNQEIAAARAQLPPTMKTASDENLRSMILNKRRHEYFKAMQGQPNLTPLQQQQLQAHRLNILRMQQQKSSQNMQVPMPANQPNQMQAPHRGQSQQTQPGQQWPPPQYAQKAGQPNPQQAKQSQSSRPAHQVPMPPSNQKSGKRSNVNDDVVEVPDPKLSQQQARVPNLKGAQFQPTSQSPLPQSNLSAQMTQEKFSALPPDQKARFQEHRRIQMENAPRASAPRPGHNAQRQRPMEGANKASTQNAGRDGRVKELRSEVMRSMPTRQPIPMSPNTRARMIERLKSTNNMSQRLEDSLPLYLTLWKDEETTKEFLRSVSESVKDTRDYKLTPFSVSFFNSNSESHRLAN